MEYIIVGDTNIHKECLIYTCGKSKETAVNVLDRIINHPTIDDMLMKMKHINIKIQEVDDKDCWWNDPSLAN